jgi:hypothetical protein
LAMLTGFCYVNLPLTRKDHSPSEIRHPGAGMAFENEEFRLRDTLLRVEGLLRLSDGLPKHIRKLIRKQLGSVYSWETNWNLGTGQYGKAREAVSKAAKLDLTFNVAMKWLLTWMSPRLALRAVHHRRETRTDLATIL